MPAFSHIARLSRPEHYQRVFDTPAYKISGKAFLMLASPCEGGHSRVGIIVAKKNIRRAVRRNRIKRLVREQFRLNRFDQPLDLVVLVRSAADQLDNPGIWRELDTMWCALKDKVSSS